MAKLIGKVDREGLSLNIEREISQKTGKDHALVISLMQAVALYFVYLAISLVDPWGYVPALVQLVIYMLLFLAMILLIWRGLKAQGNFSLKWGVKSLILSLLLLSISVIFAGDDYKRLFEIAIMPRAVFSYPAPEITLTVTPPPYSGRDVFQELIMTSQEPSMGLNPVPEGSIITLRIKNTRYAPTLTAGQQRVAFLPGLEEGTFVAQLTIHAETSWQISEGSREIVQWPMIILADEAPVFKTAELHIIKTDDGLLGLSLSLSDDYGLKELAVGVVPEGGDPKKIFDRTLIPVGDLKEFTSEVYVDLTASDYAGKKVDLVLEAKDAAGQTQKKILAGITLPKKEFSNSYARQIMEIRQGLRGLPDERTKFAGRLLALGLLQNDRQNPPIYYMALRTAYWRLTRPSHEGDVASAYDILWHLANTMEDGEEGQFNSRATALLAHLKLALFQRQDVKEVRKQLQEIDKDIILYLRSRKPAENEEVIDIKALRKIYGKILTHAHYKKYDRAIDLVAYLEQGFIYRDRNILAGLGYERFQLVRNALNIVSSLQKTQRLVMAVAFKKSVNLELASAEPVAEMTIPLSQNTKKWIVAQKKLGDAVNDLGRTLLKSGLDVSNITVAGRDLAYDIAQRMEVGEMESAAQSQGQILTLLNNLKNILDREMRLIPAENSQDPGKQK